MLFPLLLLVACHDAASPAAVGQDHGVYRSGSNAVVKGAHDGELLVWGPNGTQKRLPTPGPSGSSLLGVDGPLWVVDRELPAPPKALPVDAAKVEAASFRLRTLLAPPNTGGTLAPDAAKSGGVYVRSIVKVRRDKAPPVYVVSATGDEVGAGAFDGPKDVRRGANCKAAIALFDDKIERLLDSEVLTTATRLCAVPVIVPPIDRDGDGGLDVLVHGQNEHKGFRTWYAIVEDSLEPGPEDAWEAIP